MPKRYTGSCHCGEIQFEVNADIDYLVECNCSLCKRAGWQLTFVPADQFKLISGESALQDYQFGGKRIHHTFCRNCGVRAVGWGAGEDGGKMYSINTRCLDNFDPAGVDIRQFDGASL